MKLAFILGTAIAASTAGVAAYAQTPEATPQPVTPEMAAAMAAANQEQYDRALADALSPYAALFDVAYSAYPAVPRGVLEAISYIETDFTSLTPDPASTTGEKRYGLLGLTIDSSGLFRSNLLLVSDLSGYAVEDIERDPQVHLLAFAKAYTALAERYGITSTRPQDHLPIWRALSSLPDPETQDGFRFVNDRALYEILYVLAKPSFRTLFRSPDYELSLPDVFGDPYSRVLGAEGYDGALPDGFTAHFEAQYRAAAPLLAAQTEALAMGPAKACGKPSGMNVMNVTETAAPLSWSAV